jgi:hypothetical protein
MASIIQLVTGIVSRRRASACFSQPAATVCQRRRFSWR